MSLATRDADFGSHVANRGASGLDTRTQSLLGRRSGVFDVPSLDGIRAFAVLLVFVAHAGLSLPGGFGVTVFFFLSGYLITTLLRLEAERTGRISLGAFYLRRALRILPPMYIVLAGALILSATGFVAIAAQWKAVALQAVHLTNYFTIVSGSSDGLAPGTGVYWSLAVEEHFYLLFPLLYIGLRRFITAARRQAIILLLCCAGVLAWRSFLVFALGAATDRTNIGTDTRIDSILFGCVLAIYGNPALDDSRIGERAWKWLFFPLATVVLLATILVRDPRLQETVRYTAQGIALIPLFVIAVRYPGWGPYRLLTLRLVRFGGALSYTLYLLHQTVIFTVQQHTSWHPILQGAAALAIAVLVSTTIYVLVEKPSARLRRRLASVHRDRGLQVVPQARADAPAPVGSLA
jgi:peptidoglycan/LPS O-acetylase OafA/YrhL